MKDRLNTLREKIASENLDALYVSNLTNVRYLTGFTGSTALLFVAADGARLFVDPRYWVQADQQVGNAEVVKCGTGLNKEAFEAVKGMNLARLGFEANHLTVAARDTLTEQLPDVELVPVKELLEGMRLVKDAHEIEATRKACALVDELFTWIRDRLIPGVREVDIALDLEHEMRRRGAEADGFASIVASGVNGAKPHAGASDKPIETGDFVTMDFGARVDGYNADITRTVAIGRVSDKQREVYDVVMRAQKAAVDALKPGIGALSAEFKPQLEAALAEVVAAEQALAGVEKQIAYLKAKTIPEHEALWTDEYVKLHGSLKARFPRDAGRVEAYFEPFRKAARKPETGREEAAAGCGAGELEEEREG